ncbi:YscQ/HrcQ family type III secretion apparatus protein [Bradyrhizobium yuanmingense]|uniref:type III secretion system cytoplasmic ring protein SctQ n=1 Tax=Bradyrhizobium yuanmingense TaxID=108015 RepID=UPI0012F7A076|nr:type III secretion system cytoplasmic ring protein SctQ [Bradyrhizobium yuanmingense]MDF0522217.1 type III secretion system cytoplasmic ring protein SctQ [Bradyrhizobium yuanmingense]MVT55447.1 YscQ/HrcQ family type III secretion apparatus protein [Bradyrhizobium yuanmingense]
MSAENAIGEPARFVPPLRLSHSAVSCLNEMALRRTVLKSRLGDTPVSICINRLVWQAQPSTAPMLDCTFRVGPEMAVLSVPRPLAEALISTVQHGLTLPSDPTRSLVLELAFESWLTRLEDLLARDLQIIRIDEATTQGPYLELDIVYGTLAGTARLFLFSCLDGSVPAAFCQLGEVIRQLPREMRKLSPELPIMVASEIGSLRVSVGLVRQAQTGDALVPDVIPFAGGQIILTADKLWAPAEFAGDRLILRGPFRLQPHPLKSAYMMTRPQTQPSALPSETDIDSIEITLVFECGRWPLPLGTLRTVNEGHVFELRRPVDRPVDIIANGRLIGHGDIVRVGEELAIRLRGGLAVND